MSRTPSQCEKKFGKTPKTRILHRQRSNDRKLMQHPPSSAILSPPLASLTQNPLSRSGALPHVSLHGSVHGTEQRCSKGFTVLRGSSAAHTSVSRCHKKKNCFNHWGISRRCWCTKRECTCGVLTEVSQVVVYSSDKPFWWHRACYHFMPFPSSDSVCWLEDASMRTEASPTTQASN